MKQILTYLLLLIAFGVNAQVPDKPDPPRLVNNFSKEFPNFISANQQQTLEEQLQNFSQETSNQICIVIVDDLGDYDANTFATEIGNKWGVGQSGFKNGVVVLIKPTGGKGQRSLYISVGYGLEGAIPDLATKRIRENDIEPYFANGQFYEGLQAGVNSLMKAAKGEYDLKQDNSNKGDLQSWIKRHPILFIIIVILIILLLIANSKGKGGGGGTYFGGGFLGGLGGGSFGGGGSSGGGFGGFGGGSFGGGGSGGNW